MMTAICTDQTRLAKGRAADGASPGRFDWLLVITLLAVIELVCFGDAARRSGLFTDEWELFGRLHFVLPSLGAYIGNIFTHRLFIIRPLESVFLGSLYFAFGDKALGYHLLNLAVELFGAFFLYLAIRELFGRRRLALLTALLFLVYPNHDATHYQVTTMMGTLSLSLFNAGLYLFVKGARANHWGMIFGAWVAYTVGLFTYELCMPLIALLAIAGVIALKGSGRKILDALACYLAPFILSLGGLIFYRRVVLPVFGGGHQYPFELDWTHLTLVFNQGLHCTISPEALGFFLGMAAKEVLAHKAAGQICGLALAVSLVALSIWYWGRSGHDAESRKQDQSGPHPGDDNRDQTMSIFLPLAFGLSAVLLSYLTYALASDYMPALDTSINRINQAASLGAALMVACVVAWLSHWAMRAAGSKLVGSLMFSALGSFLIAVFILANWQFSRPWITSSIVQSKIMELVGKYKDRIAQGDSLILFNTPRYAMWAPLFDSVWDFQSMVRIKMNDERMHAGVVSDRMILGRTSVKDVSCGLVLGEYEFRNMLLLAPAPERLIEVNSAQNFISAVRRHGMGFDLTSKTLDRWQDELNNDGEDGPHSQP